MRISDWSSDVCSSDLTHPLWARSIQMPSKPGWSTAHARTSSTGIELPPYTGSSRYQSSGADASVISVGQRCSPNGSWPPAGADPRSEEHTSELQSLMRISYAVFCLKKKNQHKDKNT